MKKQVKTAQEQKVFESILQRRTHLLAKKMKQKDFYSSRGTAPRSFKL
jgi:hypothetical protein